MAKFVKVPLQDLIDAGIDGTGTPSKLTVTSTAAYTVGDYVHNTDDATYATVTAIDSGTVVSLSADIMDAAENYSVYSATVATNVRTISAERFLLAVQATAGANGIGVTTVNYASGGTDILTITHAGNLLATTTVALAFETAIINAFSNGARPSNYSTLAMPTGTGVFTLAIA
jgi:hypothetical protein